MKNIVVVLVLFILFISPVLGLSGNDEETDCNQCHDLDISEFVYEKGKNDKHNDMPNMIKIYSPYEEEYHSGYNYSKDGLDVSIIISIIVVIIVSGVINYIFRGE